MQEWIKKTIRLLAYGFRGFVSRHKKRLLIAGALAVAFVIIGIIASASPSDKNVNYIIIMRSEGKFNIMGAYFKTHLTFLLCYAIMFIGVIVGKLKFLSYVTVGFVAYRFGSLINCCISEDATAGTIYLVIYLIPVYVSLLVTLITALCMVSEARARATGTSPICINVVKDYGIKLLLCFATNCAIGIVFNIIVPCIVKLIVIV